MTMLHFGTLTVVALVQVHLCQLVQNDPAILDRTAVDQ